MRDAVCHILLWGGLSHLPGSVPTLLVQAPALALLETCLELVSLKGMSSQEHRRSSVPLWVAGEGPSLRPRSFD